MRLEPDLLPNVLTTLGVGANKGMPNAWERSISSGPTMLGTMYAGLPRQKFVIRRNARGE